MRGWWNGAAMFYDANGDGILDLLFPSYRRPGTLRLLTTRGE